VDILREALMPLADRIHAAFVFGSAPRGELHAASDVDLMVVGDTSFGDVIKLIQGAEKRPGRDVNPTVYSVAEFRAKVSAKHHFLTTVLAEPKLFVLGDEDWLRSRSVTAVGQHNESAVRSKRPPASQLQRHRAERG
jgi:uncharacterized protein